jgi:hypothetical protein
MCSSGLRNFANVRKISSCEYQKTIQYTTFPNDILHSALTQIRDFSQHGPFDTNCNVDGGASLLLSQWAQQWVGLAVLVGAAMMSVCYLFGTTT